jgi:hypothetical protein
MSEGYLVQKPIAMWNTVRGVWEKPETANLLCEHSELFSETWPSAGSMRNGMVWKPQMREPLTEDSESLSSRVKLFGTVTTATSGRSSNFRKGSNPNPVEFVEEILELMRTPAASEAERGHQPEEKAKARGGQVTLSGQFMSLLPTTRAQHGEDRNNKIYSRPSNKPQNLENALAYLPTPNTMDDLPARDESKIDRSKGGFSNVRETVVRPNFDRFEPAVRRWEEVTGHPAPAPTEPTGKDGAPRLSSKFTEWMMGLERGWITGVGLSRKDELKACGNGVVPQQAMLALKILKARFEVE